MCIVNAQLLQCIERLDRTFESTRFARSEASASVANTQDSKSALG